ncbi:MAG: Restriction endonuclease [Bacteroidetes bacterium HLUCCA01]|nr:MAG: Restriction endonuclease [Bacteroidetes bacterium HLUCCA01]
MDMLNSTVLILNQDYQPLSVCDVRKSLLLIFLEKAELLHDDPGRKVRTVRTEFSFPSVIRLRRYARIPYKHIVLTRKNIMKRDGNKCQYCGKTSDLTIDHVLPRSRGGQDTWENLVTACGKCNHKKGNRTPREAGMPLFREPYRPNHIMFLREYLGQVQEPWKPYLYMM